MTESKYIAGLHFVVSTSDESLGKHDRRAVRSHATRARVARPRRQVAQLRSWINPDRRLESTEKATPEEAHIPASVFSSNLSLGRVGSDFSGLQLPSGVEPYMIQDLVKLVDFNRHTGYPHEICLDVHPVDRGWFPYMISDICCLHSMMFSLRAFVEVSPYNEPNRLACFHYAQTLQLLQARLNAIDQMSALSDATIMVVVTLATTAELTGDLVAVETHVKGLEKIVRMRGGVQALNTHNNMHVKVCRVDLAYALLVGHRPLLFREGISWDCFIAHRGLVRCSHKPHDADVGTFAEAVMDSRLHNALQDLHAFSCMSNVAYQTTRKLSRDTYNEMMISILYRLTHLSFPDDPSQEAIRIGLLVFSSIIFVQRYFKGRSYDHLLKLFDNSLLRFRESTIDLPAPMVLWLAVLPHIAAQEEFCPVDWRSVWLDQAVVDTDIDSWPKASEVLRSIAWIGFIHDERGKQIFEAAAHRRRE